MANINDNIRTKKLYKSGNTTKAYKDSNGEIVVPSSVASEIAAVSDITELLNDHENYSSCLLYTSPSPRDPKTSRMPSSA